MTRQRGNGKSVSIDACQRTIKVREYFRWYEATNLLNSHKFLKSYHIVSTPPCCLFLISWQSFSTLDVKVRPPPGSGPRPLSKIKLSPPLIIIYEEITLRGKLPGVFHMHFLEIKRWCEDEGGTRGEMMNDEEAEEAAVTQERSNISQIEVLRRLREHSVHQRSRGHQWEWYAESGTRSLRNFIRDMAGRHYQSHRGRRRRQTGG